MKGYVVISVVLVALLSSACMVSKGKYGSAVEEADAAKAELERVQAQKAALEQQVKTLKELSVKMGQEAQLAKDELQRIQHSRDTERASLEERTKESQKQIRTLAAQHQVMRKQYHKLKQRNAALQSTVSRYQKELKERRRSAAAVTAPTPAKPATEEPTMAATPSATPQKAGQPGAKASVDRMTQAQLNLNTASVNDIVLLLGLSKEDATRVVNNRPYRIKGELVAKNVLSKQTYDSIQDRITVRQP